MQSTRTREVNVGCSDLLHSLTQEFGLFLLVQAGRGFLERGRCGPWTGVKCRTGERADFMHGEVLLQLDGYCCWCA